MTQNWIYTTDTNPSDYYGFVYLITRLDTGRMYVGRKYLTMSGGKGKPRKTSNWRDYWGSCKGLLEDIQTHGEENFKREILHWCKTRGETNYKEIEEQIKRDVLKALAPDGSRLYYNGNIMSRWFAAPVNMPPMSEAQRKAISEAQTGKVRSPETRAKMGDAKRGKPKSQTHRAKLSQSITGKKATDETRKALTRGQQKRREEELLKFGKVQRSEESKQKMREAWARRRARAEAEGVSPTFRLKAIAKQKKAAGLLEEE